MLALGDVSSALVSDYELAPGDRLVSLKEWGELLRADPEREISDDTIASYPHRFKAQADGTPDFPTVRKRYGRTEMRSLLELTEFMERHPTLGWGKGWRALFDYGEGSPEET